MNPFCGLVLIPHGAPQRGNKLPAQGKVSKANQHPGENATPQGAPLEGAKGFTNETFHHGTIIM